MSTCIYIVECNVNIDVISIGRLLGLSTKYAVFKFGDKSPLSVWNLVVCFHSD